MGQSRQYLLTVDFRGEREITKEKKRKEVGAVFVLFSFFPVAKSFPYWMICSFDPLEYETILAL